MATRKLNEEQIIDVIWGSTLLGGGGGGSLQSGIDLLEKYKSIYPNKPVFLTLYDSKDMDQHGYAAVTAGMGAPTAVKKVDFSAYAVNAFNALKELAHNLSPAREIKYSLAIELGGFNTFVPMMISLLNDIPFIDADGAGRAVPALNTLLLHINGCDTSPLAMADGNDNCLTITLDDPKNAQLAEDIGRHICMAFDMLSGLSGWMVTKEDIQERLVEGSITLSEKIGHVLRKHAKNNPDVFKILAEQRIVDCKLLGTGRVIKNETVMESGFDYGKVIVEADEEFVIYFQNENLLVSKSGSPMMTVPDIICTYDVKTGLPLTNADIEAGMEISIGAIKVDGKWWKNPDMFDVWKPFLKRVGYAGDNISY